MKKIFTIAFLSFLLSIGGLSAQFQLNTVPPLNGGNGNQGISFNLEAKRSVIIDTLYCTFTGTGTTDIWYNTSAINGAPTINGANGWTRIATNISITNTTTAGNIVAIPVDLGLFMAAGSTYGFYIDGDNAALAYTTYNTSNTSTFVDSFITIETGPNVGYGGPPPNPGFTTRQFNGGVVYTPLGGLNDAAVLSIDSPKSVCAGTSDVVATIANFGINQLDSVDINWEVNGVAQPTLSFIGLIDTLNGSFSSDTSINLGSATFTAGSNTIRVFTSNPNGGSDTTNFNDTLDFVIQTAVRPNVVTRFNPTLTTIDIDVNNIANQVDYEYGLRGFSRGTGISGNTTTLPFTLTGLTQGTEYDIYVRNNCGSGDTSLWAGPYRFITAFGLPFSQDFEAFNAGLISNWPEGWSSQNAFAGTRWESEDANGFNENSFATGPLYDHTTFGTTGGTYIYFEAGFNFAGDSANFFSPPIEIPSNQTTVEIGYWYFNYGGEIDRMVVSVDTNGVSNELVTYFGQQQTRQTDEWLKETIYLTGYAGSSIRLKFTGYEGAAGFFDQGDLAIDDVTVDTVPDLNASLLEVIDPSGNLCPGAVNPIVAVQNKGLNDISSVDVVTNINGTIDTTSFTFTAIATGDSVHLTLPSATFSSGTTYDIQFYTLNPNSGTDEVAADDTLALNNLTTGLSGAITLDPSQASSATNFTSFNALSNQVNNVGVCGAVTVTVAAGTYTDNIRMVSVPGTSPSNTLTIDGVSPDSVTLQRGTNSGSATVLFEDASYITVKNMTIENDNFGTQFGVHFSANSRYDSIVNCDILMSTSATQSVGVGASADITNNFSEGLNASFITVKDCYIFEAGYGVRFEGNSNGNWDNVGNAFINNTFEDIWNFGFYMDQQDSLLVHNNTVLPMRSAFNYAFYSFDLMNFEITRNEFLADYWGMYMGNANSGDNPDRDAIIANNIVTAFGTNTNSRGMYITNPLRINFFHNSVLTLGNQPGVHFAGFGFIDSLDVRNNIFASKGDGVSFSMTGNPDTTVFLKFDNNVFYGASSSADLLNIDGTNYASLSAYQTARPGFNINSIDGDPSFISDTNLRIVGVLINDAGDNGVNILEDVDGDVRPSPNATFVDPGADEYDPPACPSPIQFAVNVIGPDSVDASWRSGFPGSDVDVNWTPTGNAQGTGEFLTTTSDTANIGNLLPNTSYDFYIREICRRGDTSLWIGPLTITTPCSPAQARYTTNFDNMTTFEPADCWVEYITSGTGANFSNFAYAEVRNGFNATQYYSASNTITLYSYFQFNQASDTLAAISPQFIDLPNGNSEISFWTAAADIVNSMYVYTTDRQDGKGTFTIMDTIEYTAANQWDQYFIEFTTANGYNGTDEYIAFAHSLDGTFDFIRIDDFTYDTIPSCRAPRDLRASNLQANDLDLAWTDPAGASSWEIRYDTLGGSAAFDTIVSTNPFSVSGLLSNTTYEFEVRAICGAADTSLWSGILEVTTACDPFTARYIANFDDEARGVVPGCWTEYKASGAATFLDNAYAEIQGFFAGNDGFSGTQALSLYSWFGYNQATDTLAAITPRMSDLPNGNLEINFWTSTSGGNTNSLYVYTTDQPDGSGTFTIIDTITYPVDREWYNHYVSFDTANGYNGTDEYIAFAHSLDATFDYIQIDSLIYDTLPSCPAPRNLTATDIGIDSAILGWTDPTTAATSWEIRFDIGGNQFDTIVTANPFTMTNLSSATDYEWQIRALCGGGDTSVWSGSLTFRTECAPYTSRYQNNFDNETRGESPVCWVEYITDGTGVNFQNFAYASVQGFFAANNGYSSPNALVLYSYFQFSQATDTLASISPEYSDMTDGDKRIVFQTSTSDIQNELIIMTSDGQTRNSNFTVIDTIRYGTTQIWEEYTINLSTANGYNGTDKHVVFAHSLDGTFDYLRVDDFFYETIPTCLKPDQLSSTVLSGDSVIVDWTENNTATEWQIAYGAPGFDPDTATNIITTTNSPDTITGLTAGTYYDYYVRSICVVGDTSFWSRSRAFLTECPSISAPLFNGFENETLDSIPTCWTRIRTYPQPNAVVQVENFNVRTGSRSLYFYNWFNYTATDRLDAVLPIASDITSGDKRVRFWLRTSNTNSGLRVGTAASSAATATVNVLQTVTPSATNTYQEFTVDITTANGYNGTDEHIVIGHNLGQTFTQLFVDDFHYEDIPTCVRPSSLITANFPSGDSTEINWTENNAATEWEYRYGAPGFDPDTAASFFTTNKPDTITGLTSATNYEWYVRSICTAGDTSFWSQGSFQTECVGTTARYSTGFENDEIDSIPLCWTELNTNWNQFATSNVEGFYVYNGSRALVMYNYFLYTASDRLGAISPQMLDMTDANKRIKLWVWTTDTRNNLLVGTASSTSNTATFNPIDTLVPSATFTYEEFTVDLTAANGYNGTDEYIVLEHTMDINSNFDYIAVDDFRYEVAFSCSPPTSLATLNVGTDTATVTWSTLDTAATQWVVEYGPKGFTQGNGTIDTVSTDTTGIGGLSTATIYDFYVKAICSPINQSSWSQVSSFTTDCPLNPIMLPFTENWESISGSSIGGGVIVCDTTHSWIFETDKANGRLRYGTNAVAASNGSGAITMDVSTSSVTSTTKNLLVLSLDLSRYAGSSNLELTFDLRDHGDEAQAGDRIWVRGSSSDVWVQAFNIAANATATYTRYTVDIDAALANATPAQRPSASFQIRFGQEDNSPTPDDGVSIDSISVTGSVNAVGLTERNLENSISIYPNPSNGVFSLNINTVDRQNFNMIVRDVKGQTIYTNNVSVNGTYKNQLDLTGWSKGVYFLQIESETESRIEKLIVQ